MNSVYYIIMSFGLSVAIGGGIYGIPVGIAIIIIIESIRRELRDKT